MSDVKTSEFLQKLIEKSQDAADKPTVFLTVERFLFTILDMAENAADDGKESELKMAEEYISGNFKDIDSVKTVLLLRITSGKDNTILGDLYMKTRMLEAESNAEAEKREQVETLDLLKCIFENPNDIVESLLGIEDGQENSADDNDVLDVLKGFDLEAVLTGTPFADVMPFSDPTVTDDGDSYSGDGEDSSAKAQIGALVTDVKRIRKELKDVIYGQDNAINVFVTGYFQASLRSMIDKEERRPRATFLFAGPPGVGKTFLAEKSAESLGLPFERFDMSEYSNYSAISEFCGTDRAYGGKEGNVTGFVAKHPKSVLLFDEIEKAHPGVIQLFLQMLDAGRLRDNFTDKEVPFTDTIIILTTNAGRQVYRDSEDGNLSCIQRKVIIKALQEDINPATREPFFPEAICSRFAFGNVVMFNHMDAYGLCEIAKRTITKNISNFEKATEVEFEIDPRVYTALLFSEGSSADARTITGRAGTFFNKEIYELFRLIGSKNAKTDIADVEKIRICVDLDSADASIASFFVSEENTEILVFAAPDTVELCREKLPGANVLGTQDMKGAIEVMKKHEINFVLIDMRYGVAENATANLNIEDTDSLSRDFFKFLRTEKRDIPVYLLENNAEAISDEEKVSFLTRGLRGVLSVDSADFTEEVQAIAANLYQQAGMVKLAKQNKLVSYETAQTVSGDGKVAEIRLFDFKTDVAVDANDAKNILSAVSIPDVHFDDIIGAEEAKKELVSFLEYLKNPKKYIGTGVKAPKGTILYGPPGTGKTMLAKALACEAGITFIASAGNHFLQKYVGEGKDIVHDLFRTARKYAPAILFVDEIDAIAQERRGGDNAASRGEDVLTAFLEEMDGIAGDPSKPVFVLAATNFEVEPGSAKSLDGALMRRFDRRIYVDLPNKEDRIKFFRLKMEKLPALQLSDEMIENLAVRSTGMSLAQLNSAIELALRSVVRDGGFVVTDAIMEEAFETFNSGEVKKWNEDLLLRVARHEAGHALLCWLGGETPSYLTVVARGDHGGYMQHGDNEGKAIYTKDEILANIRTSLGGRAAELVYYGERDGISTGAGGDLMSATKNAQRIVCCYGMDEEFGLAVVDPSEKMSAEVRQRVNAILGEQMKEALRLISENKDKIDALVDALMTKNHLMGNEIADLLGDKK